MYRFRRMRDEDKYGLMRLLNKYKDVPQRWRSKFVINNYRSGIHVVTYNSRIVGMTHIACVNSSEAWLESAYLAPAHRGRGVGTAFTEYQMLEARNQGAQIVRVATGFSNKRVQHLMIKKLRFSRLANWYRVKIKSNAYYNSHISTMVRYVDHGKTGQCWSYINSHPDYRKSSKIITSPRDNCWYCSLDYQLLERVLLDVESLVYVAQGRIKGIVLVRKTRGMNFSCPVVLQSFCSSYGVSEQILTQLLSGNSNVFLSIYKNPERVLTSLELKGFIEYYSIKKWVIMERVL